ncbi:MAG: hypothetical protein IPP91_09245 [Betaproteobacteria bacterium]|nr:hypothetical protein [Betaproteobacteria bacterium]
MTPPPPPTTPGCTTAANVITDIRPTNRVSFALGAGQSAAVRFRAPGDGRTAGTLSSVQTPGYTIPPNVQVNVAECPGDFTTSLGDACTSYSPGENSTTQFLVGGGPFWFCVIDPTKTYYLNVRFPGCTGTCGALVDMY